MSDNSMPTPYPELNHVLSEMAARLQNILGSQLIGAYLQGSFAIGDFDEHSDVDFVIVISSELTTPQIASLQEMHGRIYELESAWAQHLEGSYFPLAVLRSTDRRGEPLWYLDNGSRVLIQSDHCNTGLVRWVVRESGVTLVGPPSVTLVDPIPVDFLRREIKRVITGWGQEILDEPERYNNRFYQTYLILNFCRMLHDLLNGRPGSKRAGAEWAKTTLDSGWHDLIDRTWDGRPNPAVSVRQPADPDDFARTLEFIRFAIGKSIEIFPD